MVNFREPSGNTILPGSRVNRGDKGRSPHTKGLKWEGKEPGSYGPLVPARCPALRRTQPGCSPSIPRHIGEGLIPFCELTPVFFGGPAQFRRVSPTSAEGGHRRTIRAHQDELVGVRDVQGVPRRQAQTLILHRSQALSQEGSITVARVGALRIVRRGVSVLAPVLFFGSPELLGFHMCSTCRRARHS